MAADADHDGRYARGDLKDLGASVGAASTKAASRFSNIVSRFAPGSLTARIVIINVIGLIVLASGILYLNQFRQGLIDARVEAMMSQAQIIAGALASSATINTDRVVIDHGTVPADELYLALRDGSRNKGEFDLRAFAAGQPAAAEEGDGYLLFRIGDAVSSRDIHAAILDANRLCRAL